MQKNLLKKKVIAITGPTASGKTKYAIQLAKKINGEIISADSRLVYKGFDIGCAKPTLDEMDGIPHYLIDVVEPEVDYSVADFYDEAKFRIEDIVSRGKVPIVCGGTGLYFKVLLENADLPRVKPDMKLRAELNIKSVEELYSLLSDLDKNLAEKIHPNNKIRLIRTIEILSYGKTGSLKEPEYDVEWIGINLERDVLYERINKRVDLMMEKGLLDETKSLLEKHGRIKNLVCTIGYRELIQYLDGEMTLEEAVDKIKQYSRNYAKRQLSWFRRNPELKF